MSDEPWDRLEPLLPQRERRFRHPGRKPLPDREVLCGILYVLHTCIRWEYLPRDLGFGSSTTCWRRLPDWNEAGVWQRLHEVLLAELNAAPLSPHPAGLVPLRGRHLPCQGANTPRQVRAFRGPQLWQQHLVQALLDTGVIPVPQWAPAGHPRAETELTRQPLPSDAGVQHEQDAAEHLPVVQRLPPGAAPSPLPHRQQLADAGHSGAPGAQTKR